jgi:hypothetical protein
MIYWLRYGNLHSDFTGVDFGKMGNTQAPKTAQALILNKYERLDVVSRMLSLSNYNGTGACNQKLPFKFMETDWSGENWGGGQYSQAVH